MNSSVKQLHGDTTATLLSAPILDVTPRPPHLPYIISHPYSGDWKNDKKIQGERLRLVPRFLLQDKVGPQLYEKTMSGYEKLSTAQGTGTGVENRQPDRGLKFNDTPRMMSVAAHVERVRASSSSNRPSSARSSGLTRKHEVALQENRGSSFRGASYRAVVLTPASSEYDVRKATPLTSPRAPRCSFGTCSRFDGGAFESTKCRPRTASATPRSGRGGSEN